LAFFQVRIFHCAILTGLFYRASQPQDPSSSPQDDGVGLPQDPSVLPQDVVQLVILNAVKDPFVYQALRNHVVR